MWHFGCERNTIATALNFDTISTGAVSEQDPEMRSTAEAIRFIPDLIYPYFRHSYTEKSMYVSIIGCLM
jgi:hypothetical protein